jgi:RNA polymerase sigma-70 factor (ECF subfamily)
MYVIEGYSHKDIGEILGISEGTSKSQLARAKGILKKMVELKLNDTLPGMN